MQAIDNALLRGLVGIGEASPLLVDAARVLTECGGSRWLVPLTLLAAVWLAIARHYRRAMAVVLVTGLGRALVELLKYGLDRARPRLVDYEITVFSQSFPSGHAANSTMVYLALALIVAPLVTSSKWPLRLALTLAVLIGLTRPVLAVHWPSDVLAGWSLGVAWTLTSIRLLEKWVGGDPRTAPGFVSR